MKLYCVYSHPYQKRADLIKVAAEELGLEFVAVEASNFDFQTFKIDKNEKYILFRCSPDEDWAVEVEAFLYSDQSVSIYRSHQPFIKRVPDDVLFLASGVKTPQTLFFRKNNQQLFKRAEKLGFPLVIKQLGWSEGRGVSAAANLEELQQKLRELDINQGCIVVKEFIDVGRPVYSYRGVVMGNEVVFVYKNQSVDKDDFRSNVNQQQRVRTRVEVTSDQAKELIKAVRVLGLEVGAVDFVIDTQDEVRVFEVNSPFNFVPIVKDLNFPIHHHLVSYLAKKANAHDQN